MVSVSPISTLFVDIGGILLTNAWDNHIRKHAADKFGLNYDEMNERHHLTFDTYEDGKLNLDEYLNRIVFYQERPFSRQEFKAFMYAQSQPFPEMIELVRRLKAQYSLRVAAVSVVYIDDRPMFVEVAQSLGIQGIVHTDYESTRKFLERMGIALQQ
jgi:putative hydrolase of the HAD superfamily